MYSLPKTASLEWLITYVVGTGAGLAAREDLASLAKPYDKLLEKLRKERDDRDAARFAAVRASAVVRVLDASFDDTVGRLSTEALAEARADEKASPYAPLFGSVKASEARNFGAARAVAFGQDLLAKLKELAVARLNPIAAALSKLVGKLDSAQETRAKAEDAAALFDIRRARLVEEIEKQVALTAIDVFKAAPGDKGLVAAVLSPEAYQSSAKKAAPKPA